MSAFHSPERWRERRQVTQFNEIRQQAPVLMGSDGGIPGGKGWSDRGVLGHAPNNRAATAGVDVCHDRDYSGNEMDKV